MASFKISNMQKYIDFILNETTNMEKSELNIKSNTYIRTINNYLHRLMMTKIKYEFVRYFMVRTSKSFPEGQLKDANDLVVKLIDKRYKFILIVASKLINIKDSIKDKCIKEQVEEALVKVLTNTRFIIEDYDGPLFRECCNCTILEDYLDIDIPDKQKVNEIVSDVVNKVLKGTPKESVFEYYYNMVKRHVHHYSMRFKINILITSGEYANTESGYAQARALLQGIRAQDMHKEHIIQLDELCRKWDIMLRTKRRDDTLIDSDVFDNLVNSNYGTVLIVDTDTHRTDMGTVRYLYFDHNNYMETRTRKCSIIDDKEVSRIVSTYKAKHPTSEIREVRLLNYN